MALAWLLGVRPSEPVESEHTDALTVVSSSSPHAPDVGRLPTAPSVGEESESTESIEDAPAALEPPTFSAGAAASTELARASGTAPSRPRSRYLGVTHIRGPPQA